MLGADADAWVLVWANIKDHAQIRMHVSNAIGHKYVGILRVESGISVVLHSYAVIRQQKCWVTRKWRILERENDYSQRTQA